VHCAATAGPEIGPVRKVNVDATRTLLDASRAAGTARWLHISTGAVYDFTKNPPLVSEDAPLKTDGDPYGLTKAQGDLAVLEAVTQGLHATILRPVAILGFHPTSTWAVRIPMRVRDGAIPLVGDGMNTWSWVHVENLVDATMLALESDIAVGRVYNVVDGQATWRAYTDHVRRWFDTPPLPSTPREEMPPGAYWTGRLSSERLRHELAWKPQLTYEDGMAEAEEYWKSVGSKRG
jgi:dTDP-glucose 4,6-dehydratase